MTISGYAGRAVSLPRPDRSARAIVAGFIASIAMVLSFGALYGVAWLLARPAFAAPPALFDWLHTLTTSAIVDLTGPMLPQAVGVYVASGLLAAVVYAELFEPRLSV